MQVIKLPKSETSRITEEASILRHLNHRNILKLVSSWYDTEKKVIIFITELLKGGTLLAYLNKIDRPNLSVIKKWCKEILEGLSYMHTLQEPIIHREIKCENIYINASNGEIKIGELGNACKLKPTMNPITITTEFMSPEMYTTSYNEKCDIYAFGMTVLQIVTRAMPYNEYRTTEHIKDACLNCVPPMSIKKIQNKGLQEFIIKCIGKQETRPSAKQLLSDEYVRK